MIKEQCLSKEIVGVSTIGSFLDLTGEGLQQPPLTLKLCLFMKLEGPVPNSSTLCHYPVIYGLLYGQGIYHIFGYRVRNRLTRRWQNEQSKQARQGLSREVGVRSHGCGVTALDSGQLAWENRSWTGGQELLAWRLEELLKEEHCPCNMRGPQWAAVKSDPILSPLLLPFKCISTGIVQSTVQPALQSDHTHLSEPG